MSRCDLLQENRVKEDWYSSRACMIQMIGKLSASFAQADFHVKENSCAEDS